MHWSMAWSVDNLDLYPTQRRVHAIVLAVVGVIDAVAVIIPVLGIHEPRPIPCPECHSTKGYVRVGLYRAQCLNCNALLKNAEVDLEDQAPQ